uniref:Uncharacterized protein n=1 Tax=Tetranychus urticae TaxID=32264 RepID=T1K088_TETUR
MISRLVILIDCRSLQPGQALKLQGLV